jgi:hypothetical protein
VSCIRPSRDDCGCESNSAAGRMRRATHRTEPGRRRGNFRAPWGRASPRTTRRYDRGRGNPDRSPSSPSRESEPPAGEEPLGAVRAETDRLADDDVQRDGSADG